MVNHSGVRKTLHESVLRKMPDFESMAVKFKEKRGNLNDLYKSYIGIAEVKMAAQVFTRSDN